jgi:chemotaxis protein methyltransferase CheR
MNDQEYSLLKVKLLDLVGVDLNFYKEAQMRRRLGNYLTIHASGDTATFLQEVKRDTANRDGPVQPWCYRQHLERRMLHRS